jgi:hypothetical protein
VDFIVRSYSARFSDYLGDGIKVTGSAVDNGGAILVHSKIAMPSSEDIRVDWLLRRADDNFAIVDIVVEGVSMGVTQRSVLASAIQERGGVNGLIEALRTKNLQSADSRTLSNATVVARQLRRTPAAGWRASRPRPWQRRRAAARAAPKSGRCEVEVSQEHG